jgi:hypothetical protein
MHIRRAASPSLLTVLPPDLLRVILSFLGLRGICLFDYALLNHELRSLYLSATHGHQITFRAGYRTGDLLSWVMNRGMLVDDLLIANRFEPFRADHEINAQTENPPNISFKS